MGTLEHRCITEAVRSLHPFLEYHQAWCHGIDFDQRSLDLRNAPLSSTAPNVLKYTINYDKLVLACGATVNTFGIEGVEKHAFILKEAEDARRIRARVLSCFEEANQRRYCSEDSLWKTCLNFVIVGGGPTGVEFAAELHDLIHDDLVRYYPQDLIASTQITIFDVADRLLGGFDQRLAEYTQDRFRREKIFIRTGTRVRAVDAEGITVDGRNEAIAEKIASRLVVWATGVTCTPLASSLKDVEHDGHSKRLLMDDHLRLLRVRSWPAKQPHYNNVPDCDDVYALGDCALIKSQPLPCTAQVAKQQAQYLANCFNRDNSMNPFIYHPKGMMVYVGGWTAVADLRKREISGRTAWLVWRSVYFSMAVSWRNKLLIPIYWFIAWLFGRDITKL